MDSVQNLLQRPREYYNIDGIGELGMGFMCLSWSWLGWMQMHTPKTSVWNRQQVFLIFLAVMVSIIHYGSKALKERFTYRRTGFVAYRPLNRYGYPILIAAVVSALLGAGVTLALRKQWDISTAASLLGLLFAAAYIRIARTVRWKWMVFFAILAGSLVIATLPADVLEAFANYSSPASSIPARAAGAYWITFVVYGAALTVSGAISFWLYLRHTQAPDADIQ